MNKKWISNEELAHELETDAKYMAEKSMRDAIFDEKRRILINDQYPLLVDLRSAGLEISSIWDLVNRKESYSHYLDIIIKHLHRPYMDRNLEGMARALATKEAKYAWNEIKDLYERSPNPSGKKNGLAVALSCIYENSKLDELVNLLKNGANGESRVLLLGPLQRRRKSNPDVTKIIQELSKDSDLNREINNWSK